MPRDDRATHSPLFGTSVRQPPTNLQAEMAVLGALLSNNRIFALVAETLLPEHFADPINARIYKAISDRVIEGKIADCVTLKQDFEYSGILEEVGGTQYLSQLLASMVGIINAPDYARAIVDCAVRRQLIEIGETIVANAFGAEPLTDAHAQIDMAEANLANIRVDSKRRARTVTGGDAIAAAVKIAEDVHRSGRPDGVTFGLPTIDRALDGLLTPGTLTLLGGLQGSGKTSLIGQMGAALGMRAMAEALADGKSWDQARRSPGMTLISLEMSAEQLGLRLAAAEAGISVSDLRKGKLDLDNSLRLNEVMARTKHMAFRIEDMRRTSWRLLAPRIRLMLQRQRELVVAIDHLLILGEQPGQAKGKGNGEINASYVGWVTGQLKDLAEELGVAMVVLTHIGRPDKNATTTRRPTMWDLKWAGEGDADNVVFVHRPSMLLDSTPPARTVRDTDLSYSKKRELWHQERDAVADVAELVVAKQRMGPGGVFRMRWHGPTATLQEWESE